jgi:hypothetical protein
MTDKAFQSCSYLPNVFQDRYREDPNTFTKEISELETLRANACIRPTQDFSGVAAVQKYYCQLQFLKNRFKVGDGHFDFAW